MRSRPLRRLAALGAAALIGIALVASVAIGRIGAGRQDLARVEEAAAGLDGLNDVTALQAEVSFVFASLLTNTGIEPAALSAQLDLANQISVRSAGAWARFSKASLDLPGERELRADFDTGLASGTAASTELGAVVFGSLSSGDPSASALQLRLDAIAATAASTLELVATLDALTALYQAELAEAAAGSEETASASTTDVARTAGAAGLVVAVAWILGMRRFAHRERTAEAERRDRAVAAERSQLEGRVQRGLAMTTDETSCLEVVDIALRGLALDSTEVLIADSSRAHFHQVIAAKGEVSGGCGVSTPSQCPAARTGQTHAFASSDSVDACPYLREHARGPCSAVCSPINIAGKAVGVMSATGECGAPPDPNLLANLELLARKTGERLGALRSLSKSELQAGTDSLTGLLNRRSVEAEAIRVLADGGTYAVAFGDLDHFKSLNDVFGHDTGDRALRLFSRVLRDSVRPQDIPGRWGGEEFVIILPGCSSSDAVQVMDRVRQNLADALEGGSTPTFTVSFGVASDSSGLPFADLVTMADAALLGAKAAGRDRTVVGGMAIPLLPDDLALQP